MPMLQFCGYFERCQFVRRGFSRMKSLSRWYFNELVPRGTKNQEKGTLLYGVQLSFSFSGLCMTLKGDDNHDHDDDADFLFCLRVFVVFFTFVLELVDSIAQI